LSAPSIAEIDCETLRERLARGDDLAKKDSKKGQNTIVPDKTDVRPLRTLTRD
jgi:hypothetical protein